MKARTLLLTLAAATGPATAAPLADALPPVARLVTERSEPLAALRLPVGPWQAGEVPTIRAEGALTRRVWQIPAPGVTPLQIIAPLRAALEEAGFALLLDCAARACGGFEFRFATDALPPPEMYVDLGDYRYISAQRSGAAGTEWVALLVSRTEALGFVQITRVRPARPGATDLPSAEPPPPLGDGPGELAALLETQGHAVLRDLAFPIGSAELGPGAFASLDALAATMRARPDLRILLVGHTDAEGALPGNIELSRRRAEAVRRRLAEVHDIAPGRMRAEGVGYLAPLATNATAGGRERNRRVEVVVDTGR